MLVAFIFVLSKWVLFLFLCISWFFVWENEFLLLVSEKKVNFAWYLCSWINGKRFLFLCLCIDWSTVCLNNSNVSLLHWVLFSEILNSLWLAEVYWLLLWRYVIAKDWWLYSFCECYSLIWFFFRNHVWERKHLYCHVFFLIAENCFCFFMFACFDWNNPMWVLKCSWWVANCITPADYKYAGHLFELFPLISGQHFLCIIGIGFS